jgi:hypothetical protein
MDRYELEMAPDYQGGEYPTMELNKKGEWVKYADAQAALTAANERAEKAEAHNYNMYDKLCKSQSETKEAERNSNNYAIALRKVEQDLATAQSQLKRLWVDCRHNKDGRCTFYNCGESDCMGILIGHCKCHELKEAALANEGREAIEHPVSNKDENYKLTTGATNK